MGTDAVLRSEATVATADRDDSLEIAVREYSRMVYRIAYSVVRNPADAEDLAQETFLRALQAGKKLAEIRDQKAWLARIAWRLAVDRRRRSSKAESTTETIEQIAAGNVGAVDQLIEHERNVLLARLVAALPEDLRDVLTLSALDELAPREIASMLGISEAAVRSRAFRARQVLRERIIGMTGKK